MAKLLIGALLTLILTIAVAAFLRLSFILDTNRRRSSWSGRQASSDSKHLLIVLGSGGHTAEMIAMLDRAVSEDNLKLRLDWRAFAHRTWIVSSGDAISAQRAIQFEDARRTLASGQDPALSPGAYTICTVPRAREIHQPLYTAPISSLRCLLACLFVLTKRTSQKFNFPDVILCNGPATATIMILASLLLRFFDLGGANSSNKMRTIYVESFARVKRLSLSGRLLLPVVDRFLVQWAQLTSTGGKAEYIGVLV